ncbi:hypothetical protein ACKKBF_B14055 [Auxenochlorella protothecoides x Auxenochlorella symbiontica]
MPGILVLSASCDAAARPAALAYLLREVRRGLSSGGEVKYVLGCGVTGGLEGSLTGLLPAIGKHMRGAQAILDASEEPACTSPDEAVAEEDAVACMTPHALDRRCAAQRVLMECVEIILQVLRGTQRGAKGSPSPGVAVTGLSDVLSALDLGGTGDCAAEAASRSFIQLLETASSLAESEQGTAPTPGAASGRQALVFLWHVLEILQILAGGGPEGAAGYEVMAGSDLGQIIHDGAREGLTRDLWTAAQALQSPCIPVAKSHPLLLPGLLSMYLSHATPRMDAIQEIARDLLPQVPGVVSGKLAHQPVSGWPSLCGHTLVHWYRAALEHLQAEWDAAVCSAQAEEKRVKTSPGRGDWEDTIAHHRRCATLFASLMSLVRVQDRRPQIMALALRWGGKFVEAFLKMLPFWRHLLQNGHQPEFHLLVKDIQKGTRILQILCAESKIQKHLPVTSQVPAMKRTVERFVFRIKLLLAETDQADAFWLGALKHKNLQGQEASSQLYPEEEEEEDPPEEEEAEEEPAAGVEPAEGVEGEESMDQDE